MHRNIHKGPIALHKKIFIKINTNLRKMELSSTFHISDKEFEWQQYPNSENLANFNLIKHFYKKSFSEAFKVAWQIYLPFLFTLLLSIIWFFFAAIIQGFAIVYSDSFYDSSSAPLKDRVHALIGNEPIKWAKDYVNFILMIYLFLTAMRFILFSRVKLAFLIATRFFWILGILQIIRGVAISVTTLTCPITCVPVLADSFGDSLLLIFKIFTAQVYECTDLIISGHSLFVTGLMLTWIYYGSRNILVLFVFISLGAFIYILIDISFYHYTIDILMAICFGSMTWFFYHHLLDIACFDYKSKNSLSTYRGYESMVRENYLFISLLSKLVAKLDGMDYYMNLQITEECYFLNWYKFPESFIPPIPSSTVSYLFPSCFKSNSSEADNELFHSLCEKHTILHKYFEQIYSSDGQLDFHLFKKTTNYNQSWRI